MNKIHHCSDNHDDSAGHGVEGDDPNVLDMDIEEDIAPQPSILYERAELFGHTTAEQLKARSNKDMDSGSDSKIYSATSNNIVNNECCILLVVMLFLLLIEVLSLKHLWAIVQIELPL